MNSQSDTLDIRPLRRHHDVPMAGVEQAERLPNNPDAAALARARIAQTPDRHEAVNSAPALPTAELVTDRNTLVKRYAAAPSVTRQGLPVPLRPVLAAIGIFALMLLLFKSPIILSQAQYIFAKPQSSPAATAPAAIIPPEPTITIPKINVHAPVLYEPSLAEANIQKALESGVVHYASTVRPGQVGNSAIFGHSSNDWWEPGNYKFVFVLLDKLAPGDRFTIDYQSTRYTYEVTGSKVVEPTDLSVLAPTPEPTVTLITCTPPGTSWKRLVVTAKQIDPNPAQAAIAKTDDGKDTANLPGAAPSFMTQLGQAWAGMWHSLFGLFGADTPEKPSQPNGQLPEAK